jgi:LmbE family N-acetylglucosaminyl deacetylase/CTP:molybdopterin cytidylyltransferase MocA
MCARELQPVRPRLLAVSPHPDDETLFMGGTLAKYAATADVRLVVVGDGENGKRAVAGPARARRPAPSEQDVFVAQRRQQCRTAARVLGIGAVEFLGFRDWSCPGLLVAALRGRLREIDPHVVVSLSEAGTTAHPDHSRTAIALFLAVRSLLRGTYGEALATRELPFVPPFALRRYFTYTLPVAAGRFDYWGELTAPRDRLTRVDVRRTIAVKRRAARAHATQAHWAAYLGHVGVLGLPEECFLERVCIGPSARGATDLLAGIERPSLRLSVSEMPLGPSAYTSSRPGLHDDLVRYTSAAEGQAIRSVILASGNGTRMRDPTTPKALHPINGRPLIRYIVDAIQASAVDDRPTVLVGPGGDQIRSVLGAGHLYVEQRQVLGTGHALACCRPALEGAEARHVMVLYGDKPAISPETVRALAVRHLHSPAAITLATVKLPDFEGRRRHLRHAGRVLRSPGGAVLRIVEYLDADDREREVTEVNGGLYCFRSEWLWSHVHRLARTNCKNEYYLTDLVAIAARDGEAVATIDLPAEEATGVNTPEDLARAREVLMVLARTSPAGARRGWAERPARTGENLF